jgi:hypothetical protein
MGLVALLGGADAPLTTSLEAASVNSAPPLPAPSGTVVRVASERELQQAVDRLTAGTTIVIASGTYVLSETLVLNGSFANVTIRGETNNRDDVVLVGRGMTNANYGPVPFGIWTGGNVTNITIANLTIRDIWDHPIILNPGTYAPRIYNVRLINAGQQFIKANPDGLGGGVDNGIVEYSIMEYTSTARSWYTNGVDVHTGHNWIIRHNLFLRIRGPQGELAGPAILIWNGSSGTLVEGNTFIDCQREISLGLEERTPDDHTGGLVRNNFIYRSPGMDRGAGAIGVWDSPGTRVVHNTILMNWQNSGSIEYRWPDTTNVLIENNLADRPDWAREGASAMVSGNVWTADSRFFLNARGGDLHLSPAATRAIDQAALSADAATDWDGQARPLGSGADVGADEYGAAAPSALQVTVNGGNVTFDWNPPTSGENPMSYRLEASLTPGGVVIATLDVATTSLFVPNVPPGTYYARVRAVNGIGMSAPSNEVVAAVAGATLPGAPTDFNTVVSGSTVTLVWNAPMTGGTPTGYVLQAGSSMGLSDLANSPIGGATTFTATRVPAGVYFVRVLAMNAAGISQPSAERVVVVGPSIF